MIKTYVEYINELVLTSKRSRLYREIDTILDEPSSSKTLSSGLLLRNKLKNDESGNLKDWVFRMFRNMPKKLSISLNNLKFLKDELKKGELRCEYCDKGPLTIYDNFSRSGEDEEYLKYPKNSGNRSNGATADHKNPISKGGETHNYENLCVCCSRCNSLKGSMEYDEWMKFMTTDDFKNPKLKSIKSGKLGRGATKRFTNYERILTRIKFNKIFKIISEIENKSIEFEVVDGYDHLDVDKILPLIIRKQAELEKLNDKGYKVVFKERHVESFNNFMNERMINLHVVIEDLIKVGKEDILDIILDINDIYDIHMNPCCFGYDDQTNKLETIGLPGSGSTAEYRCNFDLFPDCELQNRIGNQMDLIPKGFDIPVWGYLLEFWPKNGGSAAADRVCDHSSIRKIFNKINKSRLHHFDLEVEMIKKAGYSNNIGSELWAIAIYKA